MNEAMFRGLEIVPGWSIDDLKTAIDCTAAQKIIARDIDAIERQLADAARAQESGRQPDPMWLRRARNALRLKKSVLTQIEIARAKLRPAPDTLIVEAVKNIAPEVLAQAIALAQRSHPDAFPAEIGGAG